MLKSFQDARAVMLFLLLCFFPNSSHLLFWPLLVFELTFFTDPSFITKVSFSSLLTSALWSWDFFFFIPCALLYLSWISTFFFFLSVYRPAWSSCTCSLSLTYGWISLYHLTTHLLFQGISLVLSRTDVSFLHRKLFKVRSCESSFLLHTSLLTYLKDCSRQEESSLRQTLHNITFVKATTTVTKF